MAMIQNPTLLFLEFAAFLLKHHPFKLNDQNIFYTFGIGRGKCPYVTE
jgi:hypothetical protein